MPKILAGVGAVAFLLVAVILALAIMVGGHGGSLWHELDTWNRVLIVAFLVVDLGSSAWLAYYSNLPSEPRK